MLLNTPDANLFELRCVTTKRTGTQLGRHTDATPMLQDHARTLPALLQGGWAHKHGLLEIIHDNH